MKWRRDAELFGPFVVGDVVVKGLFDDEIAVGAFHEPPPPSFDQFLMGLTS